MVYDLDGQETLSMVAEEKTTIWKAIINELSTREIQYFAIENKDKNTLGVGEN